MKSIVAGVLIIGYIWSFSKLLEKFKWYEAASYVALCHFGIVAMYNLLP